MKKFRFGILVIFILCVSLSIPCMADGGFSGEYSRVLDTAGLLSDDEVSELTSLLDEISVRQCADVIVATTFDTGRYAVWEFADMLYDEGGFGYGSGHDGILLLVSLSERDWYISTCGSCINAFTDSGLDYIGELIVPYMSDGDFAGAFEKYARLCDDFLTQASTGEPYNRGTLPREPLSLSWIPISLVIGFVIALIVVAQMKSKLKTVRYRSAANGYVRKNSMRITESRDLFLYRTVSKTPRPKESAPSGESRVHTSHSGTSHGGRGGKF